MRLTSETFNNSLSPQDNARRILEKIFSNTASNITAKYLKPFECPAYISEEDLQKGKPFQKWRQRANVGVYLGRLLTHGCNFSLILSLNTVLVSPYFRAKYDPTFVVVK